MHTKLKILVIEDHKNIALVEKMCLEAEDHHVLIAEDGIQGLELALNEHPDLILLDILIPKMDGYLVLKALHENPSIMDIPVVVTSAKAQIDDLKKAFTYKIHGYLVKPFTPRELILKVNEVLSRKELNSNGKTENPDR